MTYLSLRHPPAVPSYRLRKVPFYYTFLSPFFPILAYRDSLEPMWWFLCIFNGFSFNSNVDNHNVTKYLKSNWFFRTWLYWSCQVQTNLLHYDSLIRNKEIISLQGCHNVWFFLGTDNQWLEWGSYMIWYWFCTGDNPSFPFFIYFFHLKTSLWFDWFNLHMLLIHFLYVIHKLYMGDIQVEGLTVRMFISEHIKQG